MRIHIIKCSLLQSINMGDTDTKKKREGGDSKKRGGDSDDEEKKLALKETINAVIRVNKCLKSTQFQW